MKKILILVFIIIIIVGLYFFYSDKGENSLVRVALKWRHQAQFAGIYVAIDNNYYSNQGLEIDLKEFDFGENPGEQLRGGEADVAIMSAQEFVKEVDSGADIVAIASIYQVSPYAVVSLESSGIKSPADFAGKKLGNKGGKEEEELFYIQLLRKVGLNLSDVEIVDLGFEKKELDDLLDGDADTVGLYRTDQLYFFENSGVPYNIIYPERFGTTISNDILVVNGDFLDASPEVVGAFVEGTIKGWDYSIKNIEKALDITEKYITDENYRDRKYERYILENSIPLINTGSSQKIGRIDMINMQKLYESMSAAEILNNEFDISKYLTNEFVDQI